MIYFKISRQETALLHEQGKKNPIQLMRNKMAVQVVYSRRNVKI